LSKQDPDGALICRAVEKGLTIVALHTNYDVAAGGVNDLLAERLGLAVSSPLKVTIVDELVKLVVFIPEGHESKLLEALSRFSRVIGNYSDCSFRVAGVGTFRPCEGATPYIGKEGELSSVGELRMEFILLREDIDAAVIAMKKVHPYEEPAFDLYHLVNRGEAHGLGRIGDLQKPVTLLEFAGMVKERLDIPALRFVGDQGRKVRRVAVCGGSGVSLLKEARFKGADVLVTGDVKYHEAREAEAHGIAVIDAGHFATERLMVSGLAACLERELSLKGFKADLVRFDGEKEPFLYL
jgi:dinuclear metal center YbgI/SA1388 family protein